MSEIKDVRTRMNGNLQASDSASGARNNKPLWHRRIPSDLWKGCGVLSGELCHAFAKLHCGADWMVFPNIEREGD